MIQHFKCGAMIWDPETKDYQKIETVRKMKIRGVDRVFYDLGTGVGPHPEARWREHHEVYSRQPKPEDYDL